MGGGQSLNFGLTHLDVFAWVGGFPRRPIPSRRPNSFPIRDRTREAETPVAWLRQQGRTDQHQPGCACVPQGTRRAARLACRFPWPRWRGVEQEPVPLRSAAIQVRTLSKQARPAALVHDQENQSRPRSVQLRPRRSVNPSSCIGHRHWHGRVGHEGVGRQRQVRRRLGQVP